MNAYLISFIIALVVLVGVFALVDRNEFQLPEGESVAVEESEEVSKLPEEPEKSTESLATTDTDNTTAKKQTQFRTSERQILETNGTKHSIPLDEILSGGPGKDDIPSIDNPKFLSPDDAAFLNDDSIGLGLEINGDARFYPYQILVWHEIVNDTVGGTPALVSYCPLCATGIVFGRSVNGEVQEFGVSGLLWQSNLLMYNRTGNEDTESLWAQVLGEAVVGPATGTKLSILRSNTVRFGDWVRKHPDSKVLSRDTGARRNYGRDPYGNYYSSDSVGFGATFNDDRLHQKEFVYGIEIGGAFKAYHDGALPVGTVQDTFAGKQLTIEKNEFGEVSITADGEEVPIIGSFWFSWLATHPETKLYQ